jgi:lysophospholipase L1-like esterase
VTGYTARVESFTSVERSTAWRIAAVAGIIVVALSLWWWQRPAPVAPEILFVGDSVTYLSAEQVDQQLGAEDPKVLARVGQTSTDLLPLFTEEVDRRVDADEGLQQVAILVGYNDVLKEEIDPTSIERFMTQADRFECAVWLALPTVPLHEDGTSSWNELIHDEGGSHPNVHVVDDWSDAVASADAEEILDDGVHPNAAGAALLVETYTEAIGRVC